jgi:NADH:ubiquinone oxidoreductase subunit 6 (subunit J)
MKTKRGFDGVPVALVLTFVVLIIAATIGAKVVGAIRDTMTTNTTEYNVSNKGLDAFTNYSALLPVVGTVLAAMLVIGLVLGLGALRGRK